MLASQIGNRMLVKLFLSRNAQVNMQNSVRVYVVDNDNVAFKCLQNCLQSGQTALMFASLNLTPDIVRILLGRNALVNLQNSVRSVYRVHMVADMVFECAFVSLKSGDTALMLAAHGGSIDVVKTLLKRNAQVDMQNSVSTMSRIYGHRQK